MLIVEVLYWMLFNMMTRLEMWLMMSRRWRVW